MEGIRRACQVARDILDAAHAAVRPGIMADEIDEAVSGPCSGKETLQQ